MNKIEALKAERDGLDVREAIGRYAREGWEAITEDDVQRLKWYGLFLRNPTPGYASPSLSRAPKPCCSPAQTASRASPPPASARRPGTGPCQSAPEFPILMATRARVAEWQTRRT